jgi:hypoxanthine phosphoribosyltransferase
MTNRAAKKARKALEKEPHQKREHFSWTQFDHAAKQIAEWAMATGRFRSVYGIPRGGLFLATNLSYLMDVPLILSREDITPRTLVVDDIVTTGSTMQRFMKTLSKNIRTATIFRSKTAPFRPTYHIHDTKAWIVFPWETEETSRYDGTV